jgi:hypothetical protein
MLVVERAPSMYPTQAEAASIAIAISGVVSATPPPPWKISTTGYIVGKMH